MTLTADLRIDRLAAAAHWDVVVVGSGLGGLSAAAFLAAHGRRVLVLEQHEALTWPRSSTSPVPVLFLTGAGTRHLPGVLNTLHGGAATAGAVLGRDLLAEVAAGRTYARAAGGGTARVATLADGRQDH